MLRYDRLLDGKTAWITGGAAFPYDAYARLFSEHGAKLVLIGESTENSEKLCGELKQKGGGAEFYICDLYDSDRVEALCDELLSKSSGAPDVFLHAADRYGAAYIDELDYGEFERMLSISITTPFAVVRRLAAPMAARGGGAIVFVGGYYGMQAMNRSSGYGAAKGGEISLAYSLAMEYAADNIRVNAIVPGASFPPIGEELLTVSGEADTPDFWGTVQPFRRRGRLEELANAALFLASDMSSYITGEILPVDGAQHLIAHNHNFPRINIPLP